MYCQIIKCKPSGKDIRNTQHLMDWKHYVNQEVFCRCLAIYSDLDALKYTLKKRIKNGLYIGNVDLQGLHKHILPLGKYDAVIWLCSIGVNIPENIVKNLVNMEEVNLNAIKWLLCQGYSIDINDMRVLKEKYNFHIGNFVNDILSAKIPSKNSNGVE
jgi:hypothetical protein